MLMRNHAAEQIGPRPSGARRADAAALLMCMAIAAAFLLIGSKSSPLYPMNDWVDMHCFFTVGRGWREGMLPYRDLVEQKGPILYAVYALIALFSPRSFLGVYLLEAVTVGLFLFACLKMMRLYLKDSPLHWAALAVMTALLVLSEAFCHGGSLEETALFIPAWSLYAMLRTQKEKRLLARSEALAHGALCGVCLMTKYTLCGFYLGLALAVVLWYGAERAWRRLPQVIACFLLGCALVCGAVAAYFAAQGALGDLWTGYFYNNIFVYTNAGGGQPPAKALYSAAVNAVSGTAVRLHENRAMALLIALGFAYLALRAKKEPMPLVTAALSFAALTFFTFFTGWSCTYYVLALFVFAVFGVTAAVHAAQYALRKKHIAPWLSRAAVCALMLLSLVQVYRKSGNTYLMKYSREEMPQYRFAGIIQSTPDATLLNYGFLDGGFYYASGAKPADRYFCRLMADIPQMMQEQNACVREGRADYIVMQNQQLTDLPWIDTGLYELVDQAQFRFEGDWPTYYLYRLKK